jgi:hypothetical protein
MSEHPFDPDDVHDRVVRFIAATRYPFPDQTDWPASYVTLTNDEHQQRGIATDAGMAFPDIVIVDAEADRIAEIGEVETGVDPDFTRKWALYASVCKPSSTGARSFFIYVPRGYGQDALRVLEESGVSYAGLRTYHIEPDGEIRITPIATPGDAKDHR